jgi:hypothetical protein
MFAVALYYRAVLDGIPHDPRQPAAPTSRKEHPAYGRFREWRSRTLPHASYRLACAFWTRAGRQRWSDLDSRTLRVAKQTEPQLTGIAWTARTVHLVACARVAAYEQIAKLIHCRALMRDDPDYHEQRDKRVSLVMLCDDCPPALLDFARRHRVSVIAQRTPRRTPSNGNARELGPLNVIKALSS